MRVCPRSIGADDNLRIGSDVTGAGAFDNELGTGGLLSHICLISVAEVRSWEQISLPRHKGQWKNRIGVSIPEGYIDLPQCGVFIIEVVRGVEVRFLFELGHPISVVLSNVFPIDHNVGQF